MKQIIDPETKGDYLREKIYGSTNQDLDLVVHAMWAISEKQIYNLFKKCGELLGRYGGAAYATMLQTKPEGFEIVSYSSDEINDVGDLVGEYRIGAYKSQKKVTLSIRIETADTKHTLYFDEHLVPYGQTWNGRRDTVYLKGIKKELANLKKDPSYIPKSMIIKRGTLE